MHAQLTLAEMAATAAGGLLSSYSFVADAVTTIPVLAAMVAATMITTAAAQSFGF